MVKLVQRSDERSEVDLDDEPDLLAGQKPIETDDTIKDHGFVLQTEQFTIGVNTSIGFH